MIIVTVLLKILILKIPIIITIGCEYNTEYTTLKSKVSRSGSENAGIRIIRNGSTKGTEMESENVDKTEEMHSNNNNNSLEIATKHLRFRRSYSLPLTIELAVFVDSTMQEYYGQELEKFVRTLVSIANFAFSDSSLGNSVKLALVRIVRVRDDFRARRVQNNKNKIIENDVSQRRESVDALDLLRKFCTWQFNHSDPNLSYDTAILLTRNDLCSTHANGQSPWCYTVGLADHGTICMHRQSCGVVESDGLGTGFTIAHELGHLLNLNHDNHEECLEVNKGTSSLFIMSSFLGNGANATVWSECSRTQLTKFLDAGGGHCLENEPAPTSKRFFTTAEMKLPGQIYPAEAQCRLMVGQPESTPCDGIVKNCQKLSCSVKGKGGEYCKHQGMWVDGTPCASTDGKGEKFCIRGHCVRKTNKDLLKVDGGWGAWSEAGSCSRKCNGGIQIRTRDCNNPVPQNGGRYCIGQRATYESCNTENCHECFSEFAFRAKQCSKFNGNTFNIPAVSKNVIWRPHTAGEGDDRCKLWCYDEVSYYRISPDVLIDGTKCRSNKDGRSGSAFDMCVGGKCLSSGCDHILNSTKKLDFCGVCGGDNSTCYMEQGTFEHAGAGTRTIVTIPAGAFSIKISQTSGIGAKTFEQQRLTGDNNYLVLLIRRGIKHF